MKDDEIITRFEIRNENALRENRRSYGEKMYSAANSIPYDWFEADCPQEDIG